MKHLHPVMYSFFFEETGVVSSLVRCTLEDLKEGGPAVVSNRDTGESYGSIELIDGTLVINDLNDVHMLYVKEILEDLL